VTDTILVVLSVLVVLVLGAATLVFTGVRRRGAGGAGVLDREEADRAVAPQDRGTGTGTAVTEPDETLTQEPTTAVRPAPKPAEPIVAPRQRFRERLTRSRSTLARGVAGLLSRGAGDEEAWEELEEALIGADVGVATTTELVGRLRTRARTERAVTPAALRALLREELLAVVDASADRSLALDLLADDERPGVVLVVGVNGTGKTTTIGKLALALSEEGKQTVLAAADTFRAAAADQLSIWADRVGVPVIRQGEGADPAAVAFDGLASARARSADVLLVDTAGRLHTKTNLMEELRKIRRVLEREGGSIREVLLVLDATTGQNGLLQARQFTDVVGVTGLVLTKLDGTARGGIVVAVQRELGIPVKLVGLGEGAHDLAPFDPEAFVDALLDADGAGEQAAS